MNVFLLWARLNRDTIWVESIFADHDEALKEKQRLAALLPQSTFWIDSRIVMGTDKWVFVQSPPVPNSAEVRI